MWITRRKSINNIKLFIGNQYYLSNTNFTLIHATGIFMEDAFLIVNRPITIFWIRDDAVWLLWLMSLLCCYWICFEVNFLKNNIIHFIYKKIHFIIIVFIILNILLLLLYFIPRENMLVLRTQMNHLSIDTGSLMPWMMRKKNQFWSGCCMFSRGTEYN